MRQAKQTGAAIYAALLLVCGPVARRAVAQAIPSAAAQQRLAITAAPDARATVLEDTDHLLQLARELKASVDKTRRDELSLQVIREADEIEKLARSVRARIH